MEFLGIGYQEVLLVLVLMLIVVGPERLPTVAYQIGRAVRTMQQYARAVRDEFSDEIGYIEEQYKTVKGEIDTTRQTLRQEQTKFEAEMRENTTVTLDGGGTPSNIVSFPDGASPAPVEPAQASDTPVPSEEEKPAAPPPLVF